MYCISWEDKERNERLSLYANVLYPNIYSISVVIYKWLRALHLFSTVEVFRVHYSTNIQL